MAEGTVLVFRIECPDEDAADDVREQLVEALQDLEDANRWGIEWDVRDTEGVA